MCVQEGSRKDLCLLGMTWFKQYGIKQDLETGIVLIPTGNRKQCVEVKAEALHDNSPGQVFGVSITDALDSHHQVDDSVRDLLIKHGDSFVEVSGIGVVSSATHTISLVEGSLPIQAKPYRLSWEEDKYLAGELQEMLNNGLIRPSAGVWCSPIFFVKKKTGDLRLVVDYRKLNKVTIKDHFPLPHIDDLLGSLAGSTHFSTMDAASGFHQIPMDPASIEKTGFTTKYGTFEFLVMPFGLTNAPSTFQRTMNGILGDFIGKFVLVFIDDLIIFSSSQQEHIKHLDKVLARLDKANLKLKIKKCSFNQNQVEYLGHIASKDGIRPNNSNTQKILDMPYPKNSDQVRSLLGTIGYYRRFVQNYSSVVLPLNGLLKKNARFIWTDEHKNAVDSIKTILTSPPILDYPDASKIQILTSDASSKGLGAILSQMSGGDPSTETVIAYGSRTLRGAEKNYSITHLEALGVIWAVQHYRHYLSGRHFILRTDHSALTYIFTQNTPPPKLARWASYLMDFDYDIQYKRGSDNPADSLSRLV